MTTSEQVLTGERADLLRVLNKHRGFLLHTVAGLTDEQAALRNTVSALTLSGLIKHVAQTERRWARFATVGAQAFTETVDWQTQFVLLEGETLKGWIDTYAEVAAATNELVASAPDLDVAHALPAAPWFEPGAKWSVRQVLLHIIAETSQHAGHADILRESLDGQKTMG